MSSFLVVFAVFLVLVFGETQLGDNSFYVWVYPCDSSPANGYAFCNTSLSFEDRSNDYVKQLTNADMAGLSGNGASTVSHLGISHYQWWSEGLHGVANSPGVNYGNGPAKYTTMFPQVITTSSTFNTSLFNMIGTAVGTEGRSMFNIKEAGGTYWAPNINIFRDPRWGRGQETPGEDPFLSSQYAINFVSGFQGNGKYHPYILASSCVKHFAAYSMEDSDGYTRHNFNAVVSDYDLNDTYFPAFKYGITMGGASSVMCSYNAVNGIPSCANINILNNLIRKVWNFNGYVTSDCGAVSNVENNHHYTSNDSATDQAVFSAGMDSNCGSFTQNSLEKALNNGQVDPDVVKQAMYNLVMVQMRLGLFDPPTSLPFKNLDQSDICTDYNLRLSKEAAQQGMVLLKNDGTLPLTLDNTKVISVIGPNADSTAALKGNYDGTPPFYITPLNATKTYYGSSMSNVMYNIGCKDGVACTDNSDFNDAVSTAKQGDIVMLVFGIDTSQEGEGNDRTNITLPGLQNELIGNILDSIDSSTPVILVSLNGGCVDISQWQKDSRVNSIVWGGYGGMYGGQGVMDVIYGTFAPTGLLDQTWYYSSYMNEVEMIDMNMRPNGTTNPGRGYRYYPNDVIYSFGYGLSYTTFTCSNLQKVGNTQVSVDIKNTGNVNSGAAVTVYWVPTKSGTNGIELKRLVAFGRVNMLNTGASVTLKMDLYNEFLIHNEESSGGKFLYGGACDNS